MVETGEYNVIRCTYEIVTDKVKKVKQPMIGARQLQL